MRKIILTERQYDKLKFILLEYSVGDVKDAIGTAVTGTLALAMPGPAAMVYLLSSDGTMEGVKKIFKSCGSKDMGKPTMSNSELEKINVSIFQSLQGAGTNEDMLKQNLGKFKTIPDLCRASFLYKNTYAESLFDAIDGDIDMDSEWREYVYKPLEPAIKLAKSQSKDKKTSYGAEAVGGGKSYSQKNDYIVKSEKGTTIKIPKGTGYAFKQDKNGASFRLPDGRFGWFGCKNKIFQIEGVKYKDEKGSLSGNIIKNICGTTSSKDEKPIKQGSGGFDTSTSSFDTSQFDQYI